MGRRWLRVLVVLLVVAAVVVLLRLTLFKPQPVPVTVFVAARGNVEDTVTNSKAGTVKTRKRAMISPEVGGRVAELPVREGDEVREGDVLLRLADREYRAQVTLQERAVTAAEAAEREACLAAQQAVREYERNLRLAEQKIVSQELLDRVESNRDVSRATCEAARARVAESRAALEVARVDLSKTVVRAPFSGVIAEVSTELGEWITPSPPGLPIPPVVELLQPSATYVSAPLDEVDVARVHQGQPVRITLDAYRGQEFHGTVSRVAPYVLDVEEHSRTFEIEADFADQDFARTLLPGTSADVEVILDAEENVLRIPSYALIEGGTVLVASDEQDRGFLDRLWNGGLSGDSTRLVSRTVETGLRNWAFTEIKSGLEAGERVVVSLDRAEVVAGAWAVVSAETER